MLRATWRSVFARKLRLFLSAFAVILGVAFVAGSSSSPTPSTVRSPASTSGAVGDVIVRPAGAAGSGGGGLSSTRTVPGPLVEELSSVHGAARADGRITNFGTLVVAKNGKLIGGQGPPGIAVNYSEGPAAHGTPLATLETGRFPAAAGEVVLDSPRLASRATCSGTRSRSSRRRNGHASTESLVGTATFGGSALVGTSVVMFDTSEAQSLYLGGKDAYSAIWVTAAPGTSQEQLRTAVAAALPDGFEATTGDAAAARAATRIDEALSFVNTFLLVFAGVALTVGAFLIVNTFSILVAQRSRELALLRASARAAGRSRARCSSRRPSSASSGRRSASCSGSRSRSASGCCSGGSAWTSGPASSC